ncbi:MAG TPA: hypothetical protein VLJ14_00010, partial [Ktedonobacterales bacterium]|nr:hypothetical protein [Ktedonobacterales bacterium]
MPVPPGASAGWMPAVGAGARQLDWESVDAQGEQRHRLGVAIFHDGNPGHLWRGEVASLLGEGTLSVGVVMWLAALTQSPLIVAAAVVALGLPYLLAGPLTARLENAIDPAGRLKWISRLRVVFSLGLIAMHFRTIVPVLLALLFAVSLCGRLREAWRVAALRVCLLPGEPEHVANDVQIGATVAAVLGPLLATLLYILIGERILLVSIGAALLFLISANSESFLDPLAEERRAYLLADPETVGAEGEPLDAADAAHEDAGDAGETEEERELRLPAWYQQGPTSMGEALGELRAGLGLAGASNPATAALLAITVLALAGGALAVLEVFYVVGAMRLPSFYLGPLVAAESAGLAVGALLAGVSSPRGVWRIKLVAGMMGSGAGIM